MNHRYVIVTDSTTDLAQSYAAGMGLAIIPYLFNLDGKEYFNYLDDRELPMKDFYNALREGKIASTSLVTSERYVGIFEPYLKEGKDIIYLCLSTGLSSSYSQSLLAADELAKKYPERRLVMLDSLCASMGQGMIACLAAQARDRGLSFDELTAYLRKIIPLQCAWVGVDDLNHLRRGGRVSGASAFVGTILNIKPIIHVDDAGKLIPVSKARGWNNLMNYILDRMEETLLEPKDQTVFISHSDAPERAQKLAEMLTARLGRREIIINHIGPVIGAHTGPGTIALFFQGSKR